MAEYIIALIIFIFVSGVMVVIGISQIKSKEPVGFYTGEKPPKREQLLDVERWNKKHGMIWVLYGVAIICSFVISTFINDEIISMVILLGGIVGALPAMMWYHSHIKKKYFNMDK